eukprot:126297-Pelagomonas_calceolata.AAC.2
MQEPPLRQSPSPARPATHQDSSRFWRPVGVRAAAGDWVCIPITPRTWRLGVCPITLDFVASIEEQSLS